MDIHISFQDGPIKAEIDTTEEEDYHEVLETLEEFLEDYDTGVASSLEPEQEMQQDHVEEQGETDSAEDIPEQEAQNPLIAESNVSESDFGRVIKTGRVEGEDIHEFPKIIGDTAVLGDSQAKKLLNAAAVIMAVLEDIHGISKVKTTNLKDALDESGLPDGNFGNISRYDEADIYFNRRGQGQSATIEIRPPGKEDAYDLIRELIQAYHSENAEED